MKNAEKRSFLMNILSVWTTRLLYNWCANDCVNLHRHQLNVGLSLIVCCVHNQPLDCERYHRANQTMATMATAMATHVVSWG